MAVTSAAVAVREARTEELPAGVRLLAAALGFRPEDALPAWLVQTTSRYGGVALVAVAGEALAGFSCAVPAVDRAGPFLFSCGLAVAPGERGRGIGRALKLAQGRAARERGYALIRWTADPLNAPALRLYLTGLGARAVAYHPGLHDRVRPAGALPQDDLEIEWAVAGRERAADGEATERGLTGREPAAGAVAVEVPWDLPALLREDPVAALEWRLRVRAELTRLLADGLAATGVTLDRRARRAFLRLEPA